jgi:hypothetical protein
MKFVPIIEQDVDFKRVKMNLTPEQLLRFNGDLIKIALMCALKSTYIANMDKFANYINISHDVSQLQTPFSVVIVFESQNELQLQEKLHHLIKQVLLQLITENRISNNDANETLRSVAEQTNIDFSQLAITQQDIDASQAEQRLVSSFKARDIGFFDLSLERRGRRVPDISTQASNDSDTPALKNK